MGQFGKFFEWLSATLIRECVCAQISESLITKVNISWFSWTTRLKPSIKVTITRTGWAHLRMIISKQLNLNRKVDKNHIPYLCLDLNNLKEEFMNKNIMNQGIWNK